MTILFTSCVGPGLGDWTYPLVNGYEIWHTNSRSIIFGKKDSANGLSNCLDEYIAEFCYNEQFVCIKTADVPEDLRKEIDGSYPRYYIVDTEGSRQYGPFTTEEDFLQEKETLDVGELCQWIKTTPVPEGAIFP